MHLAVEVEALEADVAIRVVVDCLDGFVGHFPSSVAEARRALDPESAEEGPLPVAGGTLDLEHSPFGCQAAGRREPGERAVRRNNAMARHNDRERIASERCSHV